MLFSLFIAGRNVDDVSFSSDRSDRDNPKKSESFTGENESQYYLQYASKGNRHLKSTVIFCCSNSSYYEFLYYEVIYLSTNYPITLFIERMDRSLH